MFTRKLLTAYSGGGPVGESERQHVHVPSPSSSPPGNSTMPGTPAQKTPDAPVSAGFLGPDRNWHLGAGLMTAATAVAFTIWAFARTGTDVNAFLLILAIAFGLFMAFNIGGNDVANSFGTSVGARSPVRSSPAVRSPRPCAAASWTSEPWTWTRSPSRSS